MRSLRRGRAPQAGSSRVGIALVLAAIATIIATTAFAVRSLDLSTTSAAPATSPTTAAVGDVVTAPTTTTEPTTTTTTSTTTTTTTEPPTTTTTAPAPPPGPAPVTYSIGSSGPEIATLEQHLVDLGIWLPEVDGTYDAMTAQAVMAFQKAAGIGRDGVAGPQTLAALDSATPIVARETGDHIEVDLERQLMLLVRGDRTFVFNTSTGRAGWRTPPGRFTITREVDGMRHAPLGDLYRPKYFNGGIALHGSSSIPGHPASHGCTRVHNQVIDLIWANDLAPIGTPVWVY